MAEKSSARRSRSHMDSADAFDVPAAVLCAMCGQADCPGHDLADDQGSGVMAIVPWERMGGSSWSRLWATATATTQGAEAFFAAMPDGALPPAVRFAILAEVLAVGSMVAVLLPVAALALPNLAAQVIADPALRMSAIRWFAVGVPALALWMVAAHATHGAALDAGARKQGARPQRRRALRFGLYACGWDLMTGPLGATVVLVTRGAKAMAEIASLTMRVPGKASLALLTGVYGLAGERAARAQRTGSLVAMLLAVLSALAMVIAFFVF
ncbi:hypothetical protein [Polyangium aurulentum]|uniref:hypothetical protein n=1 Tax=Polyangium aurulentum TaxID=2567896 RepID=UPI0010AED1E0|nr:hypothetical protein [Polyangium aurulentum]UQA62133.1 hypothetical protein E8A73_017345 [Polyangium aurulentum]